MIVYVETNFILELALEQEHHQAAIEILQLAEKRKIDLAFPGFSISESLSKVTRQSRERDELLRFLSFTLQQLGRSASYEQIVTDLDPVLALLQNAIKAASDRLLSVLSRLLSVGRLVELNSSSLSQALAYKGQLSTEDSVVYGTIISDLILRPHDESKLFLSRDAEAFGESRNKKKDPYYQRIKTELRSYNCSYIQEFDDGLGYIESELLKAE